MEEPKMSFAMKFYNNNKDKILAYKKQYYQEKNKEKLFLKHFKINGLSKRDSNNTLKLAYRWNLIVIHIEKYPANTIYDYDTCSIKEFIEKYDINGCLCCEAGIYKDKDGLEGSIINSTWTYDNILEMLVPDSNGYKLHLTIVNPIKNN